MILSCRSGISSFGEDEDEDDDDDEDEDDDEEEEELELELELEEEWEDGMRFSWCGTSEVTDFSSWSWSWRDRAPWGAHALPLPVKIPMR